LDWRLWFDGNCGAEARPKKWLCPSGGRGCAHRGGGKRHARPHRKQTPGQRREPHESLPGGIPRWLVVVPAFGAEKASNPGTKAAGGGRGMASANGFLRLPAFTQGVVDENVGG